MAALRMASENKLVEAIMVHRVDRLGRNVYSYLTLKTKLRQTGVRIVSYVEHLDARRTQAHHRKERRCLSSSLPTLQQNWRWWK